MGAFQSTIGNRSAAARGVRMAVVADRRADRERLALLLSQATGSQPAIIYRGDLSAFWASGSAASIDAVVIVLNEEPGEAVTARINALTRSTGVALVGDPCVVLKLTAADGMRARVCLCHDDLTPGSLEAALAGLLRARASENRLLRVVVDQGGQAQQMRGAGARLAHEIDVVAKAFGAFARDIADLAMNRRMRRAMALATDAAEGLEGAWGEFDRSMKGLAVEQALLGPANLNGVIEAFARTLWGADARKVSVLTSFSPIFVQADGAAVWRLLDCILQAWREARRPTDRLELLSWDAGAEAKLAVVFSREAGDFSFDDLPDAMHAPVSEFLSQLCRDLKPHAEACGARIDADHGSPAATLLNLTLSLPKKLSAPAYPLTGAASLLREHIAAPL